MTGTRLRAIGGVLTLGAVLAGAPSRASALSCRGDFWRLPDTGAVDVPTNTLLWGYRARDARLLGPSGDVVDVEERELVIGALGGVTVLVPDAELQPNAEYSIDIDSTSDPAVVEERIRFRTASGPATTPPLPPTLVTSETRTGTSWIGSASRYQTLHFEGIVEGQLALLGDVADPSDAGAAALGSLASVRELLVLRDDGRGPVLDWLSDRPTLSVGVGDCAAWPEGAADRQDARFGSFDLAGNFSGWIDVPLDLPSREVALANAERERAERERQEAEAAQRNLQEPRSAIANCSTVVPTAARRHGNAAGLSLVLGLVAAAVRRRAGRSLCTWSRRGLR
jgi:hypothetical protein